VGTGVGGDVVGKLYLVNPGGDEYNTDFGDKECALTARINGVARK
jgi:hypothetical protein